MKLTVRGLSYSVLKDRRRKAPVFWIQQEIFGRKSFEFERKLNMSGETSSFY
jgi:hypothetical protein